MQQQGILIHQQVTKLSEDSSQIIELLATNKIALVVNTVDDNATAVNDGAQIRALAISHGVLVLTSLDTLAAVVRMLISQAYLIKAI